MSDPPTTAEALADVLARLQAAVHHYQYCDSADSGDANDAVDHLNIELGELLCPESGPIDLAATLATPAAAPAEAVAVAEVPPIICLCGPTRYREAYRAANAEYTKRGYIVLSCGVFKGDPEWGEPSKIALDKLHLRKIDLAQEICLIGGYANAGESTRREIAYAERLGLPVSEWFAHVAALAQPQPAPAEFVEDSSTYLTQPAPEQEGLLTRLTNEIAGQLERRTAERDRLAVGSKEWFYLEEQRNTLENVLRDMQYALENGVTRLESMRAVALNSPLPQPAPEALRVCQTCAHWQPNEGGPHGGCAELNNPRGSHLAYLTICTTADTTTAAAALYAAFAMRPSIVTSGDFGCTLWEAKL